ncbi:hypothetical protein DFH07DRAFT_960612 [Mycena maculata]|uniref:F-box domain-containing protein n=1 Tax=Mycena maculata TaxID=230809 RepID=A0AAD7IWY3_9AGAR|nr:hypothetical protein DFH07DRAFT_960612 [Mycena maculata]
MSAIDRTPDDVLVEIFLCCLPQDKSMVASHFPRAVFSTPSTKTAPLLLCAICARWRNVAITTRLLWSSLDPKEVVNPLLVKCWLERSGQALISLSLSPYSYNSLPRHLPLLLQNIGRCRHLEIVGWFLGAGKEPSLPDTLRLESVSASMRQKDARAVQWFSAMLTNSPRLTRLHWDGPPISAAWSQLTYLSFCPTHPMDLVDVLPRLISVVELHLIYPIPYDGTAIEEAFSIPPTVSYTLPTVTTFGRELGYNLLAFLTLPNLENLIFCDRHLSSGALTIHRFLNRSGCELKSLELQHAGSHNFRFTTTT